MAAKRYTVIFYAALVVAIIATFGVYRVLEATKANSRVATAPVVIANRDLIEGQGIDRLAVVVAQWPVGTVPAGAYASIDSVAGRVARVNIFKGEALVPGRLAPEGTGPGLEVKITPGKRAMAMRINDVTGIAGLIQPNSRVDILVVIEAEAKRVAKLFMENMRVLAIGSVPDRSSEGRPINAAVATIEVTPEEAERLAIATTQGQIQLVLRGYGDPDSTNTKGATTEDVVKKLNLAPSVTQKAEVRRSAPVPKQTVVAPQPAPVAPVVVVPPKPNKPDSNTVTVIRGSTFSTQKFQADSIAAAKARADSLARRP